MLETRLPKGRCNTKQSLNASPRNSKRLPNKAANAANGNADEKRHTYPSCESNSKRSENAPSYWKKSNYIPLIVELFIKKLLDFRGNDAFNMQLKFKKKNNNPGNCNCFTNYCEFFSLNSIIYKLFV